MLSFFHIIIYLKDKINKSCVSNLSALTAYKVWSFEYQQVEIALQFVLVIKK